MALNPYLFFKGDAREAFALYEKAFGGKIVNIVAYDDMPGGAPSPEMKGKLAHICLEVNGMLLMASDEGADNYEAPKGSRVCFTGNSADESKRVFEALAEGGQIDMPLQETPFSPCFGMLTDRYGTRWFVSTQTPE